MILLDCLLNHPDAARYRRCHHARSLVLLPCRKILSMLANCSLYSQSVPVLRCLQRSYRIAINVPYETVILFVFEEDS